MLGRWLKPDRNDTIVRPEACFFPIFQAEQVFLYLALSKIPLPSNILYGSKATFIISVSTGKLADTWREQISAGSTSKEVVSSAGLYPVE